MPSFESQNTTASGRPAATGRLYQALGILLILTGVIVLVSYFIFVAPCLESPITLLLCFMVFSLAGLYACDSGTRVLNWGRRLRLVNDAFPREFPPIIYLRSFQDDLISAKAFGGVASLATEEEQLVRAFETIGPVGALGRPGERVPQIGALRMYLNDVSEKEWQIKIQEAIQKSRVVILRAGFSPGLRWELRQAIQLAAPERLLLVVPSEQSMASDFFSELQGFLPSRLPDPGQFPRKFTRSSIAGFVHFEKDWSPHFLPLRRSRWDPAVVNELVSVFQTTLQPFFRKLNLKIKLRWVSAALIHGLVLILLVLLNLAVLFMIDDPHRSPLCPR
jgi:hypothetical protein